MKALRWTAAALAAAGLLAGCGEVSNTLTAPAGTANTITVALDAPPNFTQAGLFDALGLGYFTQTDENVRYIVVAHPIDALTDGRAQVAISSEPQIILTRNGHTALAAIAAILQSPAQVRIACTTPGRKGTGTTASTTTSKSTSTSTTTTSTTRSTPRAHPPLHPERCSASSTARPLATYAHAPTYNALNFVVTENEIVNHAPILRRFIQAVGRGYAATRANPTQAAEALLAADPSLDATEQLTGIRASLANFFPSGDLANKPWGWQSVEDWNAFGTWMLENHRITNPNATPDADTNELLAGQGV